MDPLSLLSRLAASVPAPRFHTVRYAGVLASASKLRPCLAPKPAVVPPENAADVPDVPRRGCYRPWAELLKRTFGFDVLTCACCGGRMKLLAIVTDPQSVARYLRGIGEPTEVEYDFAMTSRRPRAKADKSTKGADAVATKAATNSAAELYRAEVDKVPAASRARAEAVRVAADHGTPLAFRNHRRPFAMLATLPKVQKKQLARLTRQNGAGWPSMLVNDDEWSPMQLVDVVDTQTGAIKYQLYVWSYGSGQLFEHDTTDCAGVIVQHTYDLYGSRANSLELRRGLAAAYATASPPIAEIIDFRLDEEPPIIEHVAYVSDADKARLVASLGNEHRTSRSTDELTPSQRALVREVFGPITAYPADQPRRCDRAGRWGPDPDQADRTWLHALGLPLLPIVRRELGLDPPTVSELRVENRRAWRWLAAAQTGEVVPANAIRALAAALTDDQAIDLVLQAVVQWEELLRPHGGTFAETEQDAYAARGVRLLAGVIDAKGDDAANALAERAKATLAKGREFYLAAVAALALAMSARRRGESFPETGLELVLEAQFCPGDVLLDEPLREVFALMTTEQRWAYLKRWPRPFRELIDSFTTTVRTERVGTEIVKVPMLTGAWAFADLFPVDDIAKCVVDAILAWRPCKQPEERAIEIVVALGACSVPFLEEAIPRAKGRNKRVLRAARAKLLA